MKTHSANEVKINCLFSFMLWSTLLDHELFYSTSNSIGDEEDTLKSFMTFNIIPRRPVFKVVVGSWIVVLQQSLPHNDTPSTWTHDLSSYTIYRIVKLSYSTSKPIIGNEKDTLKSFIAFDITSCKSNFRVVIGIQIMVSNVPKTVYYANLTTIDFKETTKWFHLFLFTLTNIILLPEKLLIFVSCLIL